MNKQKLKSLTYKYFWQQKFKEVGLFFGIPTLSIGLLYLLSYFGRWLDNLLGGINMMNGNSIFWEHIGYGFLGIIYLLFIFIVLFALFGAFYCWIESNWKKAKKRAREELR